MDKGAESEEEEQFIPAEGPSSDQQEEAEEDLGISDFSLAPVIRKIQKIRNFISSASQSAATV